MQPDFSRDVRCVLGLPFDAIKESQAESILRNAIVSRKRCFLSTPNLNFAVACTQDAAFRESVLQSDLSVADGWPIVAISKLTGARLPERVAGSNLFERIARSDRRPPIKVYFFGGPPGAARSASALLNARSGGATCVGFDEPGFGSVEDMSTTEHIDRVNASSADFVVVAIGAKKGQAWIQHNLSRISAPAISYLGAVVNFVAGTVSRAPRLIQAAHLEWLWRIGHEPSLWRRYASDGGALAKLMLTRVIPGAIDQWLAGRASAQTFKPALIEAGAGCAVLSLPGDWPAARLPELRRLLAEAATPNQPVALDLREAGRMDSAVIGALLLLYGWQSKAGLGWKVIGVSSRCRRSLRLLGAEYLLASR